MRQLGRLLVALGLGSAAAANAQSVSLGAKAGVNRSAFTGDFGLPSNANPFGTRTGIAGGVTLAIGFHEVLAVQVEALYTEKGVVGPDLFRMNIGYVETPVLLRATLPLDGLPFRPMIMAGVAPAWEVSCGAIGRPPYIPELPPPPPMAMDCIGWRTERRDLGGVLAGGVEVPLANVRITAEIRHTSGRTNIARGYPPFSTYNGVWSVMFGTAFSIHR